MAGSAHDGRKKSIMQTGQALLCYAVMFIIQCIIPCYAHRPGNIPYHTLLYGMQALAGRNQGDRGGVGRVLTLGRGNGQMLEVAILQTKWYLTWILAFGRFLGGVGNSSIHTHHLVRGGCQVACQEVLYVHLQPTH